MGVVINFSTHSQVTTTGKEVLFFSRDNRLLLLAKPGGKQGRFRIYALIDQGLVDLHVELKSFQFNVLIPVIEQIGRKLTPAEWQVALGPVAKDFNFMKVKAYERKDKK